MSHHAVSLLRALYKSGHDVVEGTMADVTDEMLAWQPPGNANTIAANYAHIVTGEDALVLGMARGAAPLMATSWAGKIGMSEPPPPGAAMHEWSQRTTIDLTALRQYAQAVYAATDEYLASLSDADLAEQIDASAFGAGMQPRSYLLGLLLANLHWHTGEIACLKGIQGKRGYPF
jgi:hypothetical protein